MVILIRGYKIQILDPNHVNSACFVFFIFLFLVLFSLSSWIGVRSQLIEELGLKKTQQGL